MLKHDLSTRDAAKQIHQACSQPPGTVLLGFPCQQALILECTQGAGQNVDIQAALQDLAETMDWKILQIEFDLADM